MNDSPSPRPRPDSSRSDAAARWLARRDRGLREAEQKEFAQWMRDPGNARTLAEMEGPFSALDRVAALRPTRGATPNADLLTTFERPSSRRRLRAATWVTAGLAAAAAIVFAVLPSIRPLREPTDLPPRGLVVRHSPERLDLPDGSTVELKPGSRVVPAFTRDERRVRLLAGDAHFAVAKDASRPFIVEVGHVAVRAVGTAFTVSTSAATVEVVVTEGRVRVDDAEGRSLIEQRPELPATAAVQSAPLGEAALAAGQSVVIPVGPGALSPATVTAATRDTLERAAAWRVVWLEFSEMPLAEVIREFNRHSREIHHRILKIADNSTGQVLVSGTFRADGTEAFVRLLKSSFGIEATARADGSVVLSRGE